MEMVKNGEIQRILVWRFDRFARSTQHLLSALKQFQSLGIDFISYNEGIDTSTSVGKMVFTFLGAIAEFERELIRERIQAGLRRAKNSNIKFGRPRTGFDFEKAIKLRKDGLGFREISIILNVSIGKLHKFIKSADVHKTIA
jgi:DNA invertase Pin-like site-specific DNA recombinase